MSCSFLPSRSTITGNHVPGGWRWTTAIKSTPLVELYARRFKQQILLAEIQQQQRYYLP